MMKKNENGYALVLVLLMITIVFTLALSISGTVFSARKQIDKTDEINRATDLAEMGVAHYEALVTKFVTEANTYAEKIIIEENRPASDYDQLFKEQLTAKIASTRNISLLIEGSNSYEVKNVNYKEITNHSKIIISFKSEGNTGKEQKVLLSSMTIEKGGSSESLIGNPAPTSTNYEIFIDSPLTVNKGTLYETSSYFNREITLNGGNKKPFIINGNAFFNDMFTIHGSARIEVRGDAIFKKKLSETEKSYSFCITGNAYLIDHEGSLIEYQDFPAGRADTCVKTTTGTWSFDPYNGIIVTY